MAFGLVDLIPDEWFVPERRDDVCTLLQRIAADPQECKILLIEWARAAGVELTREDFIRCCGERAFPGG